MFRGIGVAVRRFGKWLSHYDWPAIIGSALVLAFFFLVVAPNLPVGEQQKAQATADYEGDEQGPDVSEAQSTDNRIATYTLWLTVFTGGLVFATILLWYVTQKTLRHAERSSERQLRAYMALDKTKLDDLKVGESFTYLISLKNTGQTPARNCRMTIGMACRDTPWTDVPVLSQRANAPSTHVGPGQTTKSIGISEYIVEQRFIDAIEAGTAAVFIIGLCTYVDVFGNERETRFRLVHGAEWRNRHGLFHDREGNDAT